jgi:ADP-heptose:LPS heptosyltransferase
MMDRGLSTLSLSPKQLEHLAYGGDAGAVYRYYRALAGEDRPAYWNKYVLSQAMCEAIDRSEGIDRAVPGAEQVIVALELDAASFLADFGEHCRNTARYPLEFFESIERWAAYLLERERFAEALGAARAGLEAGASRYPATRVALAVTEATGLARVGDVGRAKELLADLAERPYLLIDRNLTPKILSSLHHAALMSGDSRYYNRLIWRNLLLFHTNDVLRRAATEQISRTYGHWYRALLTQDVRLRARFLYALHVAHFAWSRSRVVKALRLDRPSRWVMLAATFAANYARPDGLRQPWIADTVARGARASLPKDTSVIVTRAMGGLGDILTMTPGLHALKQADPDRTVYFAIPRQFHALFQGNPDVELLDIENGRIDVSQFGAWYNLTDCPAARVESRTAPNVKKNRIDIFAAAMGKRGRALRGMLRKPRYFVSDSERAFARQFFLDNGLANQPVIGIQLSSAESYRDYPALDVLAMELARNRKLILFHNEKIDGYAHPNIIKVDQQPFRLAFALAGRCRLVLAPDSALMHLAAALDIPTIAVFGPTDAEVRTRYYEHCVAMDARIELACIPCWRNERIPCAITGGRQSACMRLISPQQIQTKIEGILGE